MTVVGEDLRRALRKAWDEIQRQDAALDDARAEIERLKEAWSGDIAVLKADRDRAVRLLREAVAAERIDSDGLGHAALAGDSALGVWLALSVDPFLAELDGDPYFASPR